MCNPLWMRPGNEPMLIIDGVIQLPGDPSLSANSKLSELNKSIQSIIVVTGKQAVDLYGLHARKGVVNVTTRRDSTPR